MNGDAGRGRSGGDEIGTASIPPAGFDAIDWTRPWLAPLRARGEAVARDARRHGLVASLNAALTEPITLRAGRLRFVEQAALPAGEAHESFIACSACIPTRNNLHDFFNGLAWLAWPALKRRINELHAERLATARPGEPRGAMGDALTLFDENGALFDAPPVLIDALRRRDWQTLFITQRAVWADARLRLFGHALLEKLVRPRKPITAHVWVSTEPLNCEVALARAAQQWLAPCTLVSKAHLALPVLGVPGWYAANEERDFYCDAAVFRPPSPAP